MKIDYKQKKLPKKARYFYNQLSGKMPGKKFIEQRSHQNYLI